MAKHIKTTRRSRYLTEDIGERLKALRLERGLTLTRLAALSGVPASTISKIENRQLRPSLVNAINLAMALEENLGFLVDRYRSRPEPVAVVRAGSRDTIEYDEMGLTLQDLSGPFLPGVLEARLGILGRGAHPGVGSMTHRGEEFCLVLSGAISYRLDEDTHDLSVDEYLHFRSDLPHSWENAVADETRVLWIFSDGLSF